MSTSEYINCLNDIENTIDTMSHDDLEALAIKTQETLESLMNELKKRQVEEMHGEIDHLEDYLYTATTSFKSLKELITMALKSIRDDKGKSKEEGTVTSHQSTNDTTK